MINTASNSTAHAATSAKNPYQVMLVDDSATVRGLARNWLNAVPEVEVVASCCNGLLALKSLEKVTPEVILLDIEMPVMDGLTALPQLLKAVPNAKVIIVSTLTKRNAEVSLKALSDGASDYVSKPESAHGLAGSAEYQRTLVEKVLIFGRAAREKVGLPLPVVSQEAVGASQKPEAVLSSPSKATSLQKVSKTAPRIIAIGSSTGGPQALFEVLVGLAKENGLPPIVITQHMPKTFTGILAEHLEKKIGRPVFEATDGQAILPGEVYIAPGDYHMLITGSASTPKVKLAQSEQENFCRPSVNPMFRSAVQIYGAAVLSVMLTGMGHDGLDGTKSVVEAGGTMVAQDKQSSVVWGMPGAVAEAGLCAKILPLGEISAALIKIIRGRA